jgi:hypothetical protein
LAHGRIGAGLRTGLRSAPGRLLLCREPWAIAFVLFSIQKYERLHLMIFKVKILTTGGYMTTKEALYISLISEELQVMESPEDKIEM